jgi:predicted Zn-dependent protease
MMNEFYLLSDRLFESIFDNEVLALNFGGEISDFVRFNKGKLRQAGNVEQKSLTIKLAQGSKVLSGGFNLSSNADSDFEHAKQIIETLRENLEGAPQDPLFDLNKEVSNTESLKMAELPSSVEMVQTISEYAEGLDLVGILATGEIHRGFSSSLGHRNFFVRNNFNFDFACYLEADKAIKSSYAGVEFKESDLKEKFEQVRRELKALSNESRTLDPGKYRVYLSPAALDEMVSIMNWGGFSKKAIETKSSPLNHLVSGAKSLDSRITISQNTKDGFSANFDDSGNTLPDRVSLVESGKFIEPLSSSRSAKEYECSVNASSEYVSSFEMQGGKVSNKEMLNHLGTGLYISNLWYLNFSDMASGRVTGMTRFGTFWVENGEIKYPVNVMRFDDSLFDVFGENLCALTLDRDYILDPGTYGSRSTGSKLLPGAFINDFNLTL